MKQKTIKTLLFTGTLCFSVLGTILPAKDTEPALPELVPTQAPAETDHSNNEIGIIPFSDLEELRST